MMFVSVLCLRTEWTLFDSEPMLHDACGICQRLTKQLLNHTEMIPIENSVCSNPNTTNKYCHLVTNLTLDIKEKYGNKIPNAACAMIGPCVPSNIPDVGGENCFQCRYLTAISILKRKARTQFAKLFCSTARNTFSDFCQKIEDPSSNYFKYLESAPNVSYVCKNTGFCRYKGSKAKAKVHGPRRVQFPKEDL